MSKPVFLLCVGCHRGGTTWLAEYLRGFPEVRLGARKEMHVLDVHFLEASRDYHTSRIARAETQMAKLGMSDGQVRGALKRRIEKHREAMALTADLNDYARYFRERADRTGVGVVANITPGYALLSSAHWEVVRSVLDDHGFAARILFLLRDPVGRLESGWRRVEARDEVEQAERGAGALARAVRRLTGRVRRLAPSAGAVETGDFAAFATQDQNAGRSDYRRTMEAVDAVFPPGDIRYDFYETLFSMDSLAGITGFVDLEPRPADFGARVNASLGGAPIPAEARARVREILDPTYRYCAERFGEAKIRSIWKTY